MPTSRARAVSLAFMVLGTLTVAGCAASAAPAAERSETQTAPVTAEPTSTATTPPLGEAAISSAHICGQVTTLLTMTRNAADGHRVGKLEDSAYAADLLTAAAGYRHVLHDDSAVGTGVDALVTYLDAATPTAEGAPFDPDADEWWTAIADLSSACDEAGSSLPTLLDYAG